MQGKKWEVKQRTYAHNKSKLRFAIFWGGGAKTDPRCEATCQDVGSGSRSRMGRKRALKMSMSDSSATIWRWMEQLAMMEPPKTWKWKNMRLLKSMAISKRKKLNTETHKDEEQTSATLPIHANVVLVHEGGEKNREKLVALFMSSYPRYIVLPHSMVLILGEAVQPTILLENVIQLFEVHSMYIHNEVIPHKDLDKNKLANLHQMCT